MPKFKKQNITLLRVCTPEEGRAAAHALDMLGYGSPCGDDIIVRKLEHHERIIYDRDNKPVVEMVDGKPEVKISECTYGVFYPGTDIIKTFNRIGKLIEFATGQPVTVPGFVKEMMKNPQNAVDIANATGLAPKGRPFKLKEAVPEVDTAKKDAEPAPTPLPAPTKTRAKKTVVKKKK